MKLNILSDLHLGSGGMDRPINDAEMVVAGDISRPRDAIAWALKFDKPVLYVPGNHELYAAASTVHSKSFATWSKGTQVQVLGNREVVIGAVRFLGTTL